jgi:hypothetical protein
VYIGAYNAAKVALTIAQATVDGPGYSAAQQSVDTYQSSLDLARRSAQTTIDSAEATLRTARETQDGYIKSAEAHLRVVRENGTEEQLFEAAKKKARDWEAQMLPMIQNALAEVSGLANAAEKTIYENASAALTFARDDKSAWQAAQKALDTAQAIENIGEHVASYILDHADSIVDVNMVNLDGQLKSLLTGAKPLDAEVHGKLGGQSFDIDVTFTPGKAGQFIHSIFEELWTNLVDGILSIV